MSVYRETDGNIVREYKLKEESRILSLRSNQALIELVPTLEYGLCLFLDNELQFAEFDESIYHEAFVHPALSFAGRQKNVCIIGGGDGCAAREVLKWPSITSIDLIDWDSTMTQLFSKEFVYLNQKSLQDPRVHIENVSIQSCLHDERIYDCILVDLLDPDFSKDYQEDLWYDVLYCCKQWRSECGSVVINIGGILPWQTQTIVRMLKLFETRMDLPYRLYKVFVPSFGREWCFALFSQSQQDTLNQLPKGLRYLTQQTWMSANIWFPDTTVHLNPVSNRD